MSRGVTKHIIYGLAFALSQLLIFQYLPLYGATADIVLIFLLWISLKYERYEILFFAAGLGLFQDFLFDTWGLNMFAKTLTFFIIHKFIYRNSANQLLIWQAFGLIIFGAFVHNIVYLIFASFLDVYNSISYPIIILFLSSIYTGILGTIMFILKGNSIK